MDPCPTAMDDVQIQIQSVLRCLQIHIWLKLFYKEPISSFCVN